MAKDFTQSEWDEATQHDCRRLVQLWVQEDLHGQHDWTTRALVAPGTHGQASIVNRAPGGICGLLAAEVATDEMALEITWTRKVSDGTTVSAGTTVAQLSGQACDLLTAERLLLNLIGRMSAVATTTRQYADAILPTNAAIYDTRKMLPGWRRLEKYAVRCGGGRNHRTGLFDGILIKDNHLAMAAADQEHEPENFFGAVARCREFLDQIQPNGPPSTMIVEIEVDTLDQLRAVLPANPDIVLLDNMSIDEIRQAVVLRDALNPDVELESSGGIQLDNVLAIAESGVERISIGALTHSATNLDVAMDWQ